MSDGQCLKLHVHCSTVFEISTFSLWVLCGHRYQTSQLPKCQSIHWGTSEEADSLTLPSPYWLRPHSSITTSWPCLLMCHQIRPPASHSPIPRTRVHCPGTAPAGGWFQDLLPTQSWEEEEDGGVRPPVQPSLDQPNQCSNSKKPKLHPATSSTLATGTVRRPLGRATRTGPRGYPSGDTPAGRGDSPRQTKRTRQLIRLDNKTLKKTKKTTYTPRKKNKHQNFEKIQKKINF